MSDIQERLKESSKTCLDSYEAWNGNKKDSDGRENLQESIHELRKVISRLEIEIAVSERDNSSNKPIPIPTHRSQNKKDANSESILPDHGQTEEQNNRGRNNNGGGRRQQRSRKTAGKKAD
ncbi:MAG: hypothetical protein AAGB32_06095 [Pseudomonadota bacterium]